MLLVRLTPGFSVVVYFPRKASGKWFVTKLFSKAPATNTGQGAVRMTLATVLRRKSPQGPTAPWLAMMIKSAEPFLASFTICRLGLPVATTVSVTISLPHKTSAS